MERLRVRVFNARSSVGWGVEEVVVRHGENKKGKYKR